MFKIEKNVPIEKDGYPFEEMEIGDSFFAEGKLISSVSQKASLYGKVNSKRFTCKTVIGGVRVWRIA